MDIYRIREELTKGKTIFDLPLRVTFYARVSTEKEVQLNSLENQKYYYPNYIKNIKNWTYVDGYVDEGISASSTLKRDNFLKMAMDTKLDKFDLVLTKEISRFSRDTLDSIGYARKFLSNGVGILFESDNINTLYPDSELRLTIMASIAQDELRKLSERVRFGMKRSIEQKKVLGNNSIYGFNKNKCTLEIDEKEAEFVREVFSLYGTGKYGFKKLAKILYNKGYKSRKGKLLETTTLTRMIRNPKYKGYYCTNTVARLDYKNKKQIRIPQEKWKVFECKDKIPAIVSEELWNKCNEILKARSDSFKNKQKDKTIFQHRYAFSSLIYCADHKEPIPFHRVCGEKRANRPTWACYKYIKEGLKACQSPILVESELYTIMKEIIKDYIDNKSEIIADLLKRYEEMSSNIEYEQNIKKLNDKIQDLKKKKEKLLELVMNEYIDNQEFKNRNDILNDEIQQNEYKIQDIENQKKSINDFKKELQNLNIEITNELEFENNIDEYIKLLIDKILVYKIDDDRKKVKLEIYFKLGDNKSVQYDMKKGTYKKYLLCGHQENYDCYNYYREL